MVALGKTTKRDKMNPHRRGSVRYNGVEELLRIAGDLGHLPNGPKLGANGPDAEYPIEYAAHNTQNRLPNGFPPAPIYAEYSSSYRGSNSRLPHNSVS